MTNVRRKIPARFPVGTLALVLLAGTPGAMAGEPIDRRAAAEPNGSVEISNTAGHVTITGWDRNEVEVTGTLGKGVERLDVSSAGPVTRVQVVLPNRSFHVEDTDLVVKVPAASALQVNTVSADIRVGGVRGSQRLQAVSADVTTEAGTEDVECKTVSGNVRVTGAGQQSLLTINTVSGDIFATRVAGEVNGNTVSGNIELGVGNASRSRLRSTSGDVVVASRLAADAKLDLESISGDVKLSVVGPVNAEFEVSSFNGDIRNCFGHKPARTSEFAPGTELRFRDGDGTGRVCIKTLNGDISICTK
jgi:DUF4097 and DUF4098 domain-containing protein YvlB